ncbi:ferredoxin-NADP reductase [Actinocorallia herbida]|uniref:Ferredoxin-NADP reductase n=1 Tax=Actinocorallia herbida TaxID=58109 RepID=A0A3N1CY64_9ACTN|nr:PDR/VanB family oxidoreductase [Actinocorallia herbida]ROO86211.1 ferredoxin-NADP reductase [Actinocorallia herbida]
MSEGRELVVRAAVDAAPRVRSLRLARPDGGPLPAYVPGSHLVVECDGARNAYSLTGSGAASDEYPVSVLLRPDGAGGSAWMHRLRPGERVRASGPRSAFAPVATARRHLLVAGGIGITPLLSHVRSALAWDRDFRLLYGHRKGGAAHLAELRELCGDRLRTYTSRETLLAAATARLSAQPLGTHLYLCGPAGMIDAVRDLARVAGWPDGRVHIERFAGADLDPGAPFTARLRRSGRIVEVPSGVSLLDALERSGIAVPNLCRQGVCGECRIPLAAGRPEHRDLYLSAAERASGTALMCCVSRGTELELDL